MRETAENYFVDGGTLRPDTPSYVKRSTDDELFNALLAGEYCYILTPRQMGKSSLMIQTSQRLKNQNFKTAILDFQATGTVPIREWYGSVLSQIRRGLKLSVDIDAWMKQRSYLSYGQMFVEFIQDFVLDQIDKPIVIFVDEIDWMLKLDFRDDFFASIRALYNARAQYPELSRISFVLLGVAAPADLIAEPTRTPFNVGRAISLQEFSLEEGIPLEVGLERIYPRQGKQILKRIFHWTNGHPYLTQKICKSIVESDIPNWSEEDVDRLVHQLFLSDEFSKEGNLKFIQDRILNNNRNVELLNLYKRSLTIEVGEDRQDILQNELMLSGLLTSGSGHLIVRNRIYQTVFNNKWIDQSLAVIFNEKRIDPDLFAYFVDGGTLRPDTPSYVKRPEDDELFKALLSGEYCYILAARQMGKSSLMVHTSQRLRELNVKTALIDLQSIGADQIKFWYGTLLSQIRRALRLSVDIDKWMAEKSNVGFGQLFVDFIQDVVLTEISEPVVIFIDEVDWMLKLDFREDFFASIRSIYNSRAQYPEFKRLGFVLLGTALPDDLTTETTRSPLNISHVIYLNEFSIEDATPLLGGLERVCPGDGKFILERIFYWTNGHPYLTQKLCKAITESGKTKWSVEEIDQLVKDLFLSESSRNEANLKFIQDRILGSEQYTDLLKFYKRLLTARVRENRQSIVQNQLMLSGLLTSSDGYIKVRNRIYRTVFDEKWINHHMPKDWQRIVNVVLGVVLGVLIITFTTIIASDSSKERNRLPVYRGDFFSARSTADKVASLANIFRTHGILRDLGEDHIARNLFFDELKSRDDQLGLFTDYKEFGSADGASLRENPELQQDLIVIIRGVYYSLAMVDPTRDNTELLQAMWGCLGEMQSETASTLRNEIGYWLDARKSIATARAWKMDENPLNDAGIPSQYDTARDNYGKAITINPGNPALYFERAQLYISLRDISDADDLTIGKNALKDLNDTIGILKFRTSRDVPPVPSATPIVATGTTTATRISETATPAPVPAYAGAGENTATPSRLQFPTSRPEAIIVTQKPVTFTPTVPPKSVSRTATATAILDPIEFLAITSSPLPGPFERGFYKNNQDEYADILSAVQSVLKNNPWLGDILVADPNSYPNLQLVGFATVYPTLTPSPILTATSTPTLIVPVLADLQTITEENASSVNLLAQLGRGSIRSAVYSPDGTIFAVGSSLGIYFYDSASLDLLGSIATVDAVSNLAFSPNGQVIASSLDSLGIYFWNVSSRVPVGRVLVGHSGEIRDLAFSPDGAMLASASADNTVILWRVRDGRVIERIEHPDVVRSVAFTSAGDFLASASAAPIQDDPATASNEANPDAGKIWLWHVPNADTPISGQPVPVRELETVGSSTVAFSPDGQILAAGSDEDSIRLWRVNDGRFLTFVAGGGADIAFSPDGKILAAVSLKSDVISLRKTDKNSLELITSLAGHGDSVLRTMFSPDSRTLLSTSVDNTVRLWDVRSGKQQSELDDHVTSPYVAISPDGKLIASGGKDGNIYLWQLSEAKIIETLEGHTSAVRTLAFNWDGTKLASGSDDGTVRIWDVTDGSLLFTLSGHTSNVFAVAFAPGQNWLISGSADGTIRLWDSNSGASLMGPVPGSSPTQYTVYSLAFPPGVLNVFPIAVGLGEPQIGVYYSGSEGPNAIRLIPAAGTIMIDPLRGHTKAVRTLAFSPDGEILASGSDDNTVRLWQVKSSGGSQLTVLNGHTDTVRSVAFSPDSRILASASYDRTIRLWSVNSESVLRVLTGHRAEIYSMAVSPDGKYIVSGSPDGTICIWGISP